MRVIHICSFVSDTQFASSGETLTHLVQDVRQLALGLSEASGCWDISAGLKMGYNVTYAQDA